MGGVDGFTSFTSGGRLVVRIPVGNVQLSVRAALAATVSLALARVWSLEHPVYAMLAAVIVTDLAPSQTRKLGVRRLAATVTGAGCGALLSSALPSAPWSVGIAILVAMLISAVVRIPEAARVAGYTCGIVVLSHGADPWRYAYFRLIETGLGILVAWLISLVPKAIRIDDSGEQTLEPLPVAGRR
jgi:uncharacterized membrane protein YgaE (UPF0421/DUF939 family)